MKKKTTIIFIGDKNVGHGDKAGRQSMRHGNNIGWMRGHSENQDAVEVNSRGSWWLCITSLIQQIIIDQHRIQTNH